MISDNSTRVGVYCPNIDQVPESPFVPSVTPGEPSTFGNLNDVNSNQTRLQKTPMIMSTDENITKPVFSLFRLNSKIESGMTNPNITCPQKNGAMDPDSISFNINILEASCG